MSTVRWLAGPRSSRGGAFEDMAFASRGVGDGAGGFALECTRTLDRSKAKRNGYRGSRRCHVFVAPVVLYPSRSHRRGSTAASPARRYDLGHWCRPPPDPPYVVRVARFTRPPARTG